METAITGVEQKHRSLYETNQAQARTDIRIKRVFLATIVVINFALLSAAYSYVIMYYPLPDNTLLSTSFLAGVITGMISLGIDTYGIDTTNINQFFSPIVIFGKGLAYTFFGPVVLYKKLVDLTDYSDPNIVGGIQKELEGEFKFLVENYSFELITKGKRGPKISNLVKYGLIDAKKTQELMTFYHEYKQLLLSKEYLEKFVKVEEITTKSAEGMPEGNISTNKNAFATKHETMILKLREQLKKQEARWQEIKEKILLRPNPQPYIPNFENHTICAQHIMFGNVKNFLMPPKKA